jgi:hypothetical protein
MMTRHLKFVLLLAGTVTMGWPEACDAQCCLSNLFAGCGTCFRTAPPAYAVAPVMAPVAAPIPAPPPPVVVPVQQVSYVPETTYRTQYQCVPVTSYKPSCEIDPCTGCPRECMEQVTNYVQQAVNVPYTQYRAVYSTKYVQMQPGYNAQPGYGMPAGTAAPVVAPGPSSPATSPFAAPVQTTPQAWGAAGADVPQQLIPGSQSIAAPALPSGAPPTYSQPTFQQQIVPQGGTYAQPAPVSPQPTAPPSLSPTPSLKPIPELPRTTAPGNASGLGTAAPSQPTGDLRSSAPVQVPQQPVTPQPANPATGSAPSGTTSGGPGMPILPGQGPNAATGAFPKLLEPTSHTTSWQPASPRQPAPAAMIQSVWQPATVAAGPAGHGNRYPTAALPSRLQQ